MGKNGLDTARTGKGSMCH